MIHSYASLSHYDDHLAPILDALPPDLVGSSWSPSDSKPWGLTLGRATPPGGVWLVASYADACSSAMAGRHLVYVEHGAGQTYPGDRRSAGHGAFSGGAGLGHVGLFICPSTTVADRWRAAYPGARAVAVGCPKLDRWHAAVPVTVHHGDRPVVAITFHHEHAQIPEQTSAWTHYRDGLAPLVDHVRGLGGLVLGHGHPRAWRTYQALWRRLGVPCTADLGDVFDRADLLLGDNTSALPEFASLGRPVVWLNAPWYRRGVYHGGRFWDWPAGQVQGDGPGELVAAVETALGDPQEVRYARQRMIHSIYAHTDGTSSARAAEAVMEYHSALR